jgi:hypothetical protein
METLMSRAEDWINGELVSCETSSPRIRPVLSEVLPGSTARICSGDRSAGAFGYGGVARYQSERDHALHGECCVRLREYGVIAAESNKEGGDVATEPDQLRPSWLLRHNKERS